MTADGGSGLEPAGDGAPPAGEPPTGRDAGGQAARSDAPAWLEPRLGRVPDELAERVRALVGRAGPGPVPDRLAGAAVEELERLADAPQDREAAIRLLAADAALTWAFEAAAELGGDVPGLTDATGLRGRIGRLLRERASGPEGGSG